MVSVRVTHLPTVALRKNVSFAENDVSEVHELESRKPYLKDMYYQEHEYCRFYYSAQREDLRRQLTKKIGRMFTRKHHQDQPQEKPLRITFWGSGEADLLSSTKSLLHIIQWLLSFPVNSFFPPSKKTNTVPCYHYMILLLHKAIF